MRVGRINRAQDFMLVLVAAWGERILVADDEGAAALVRMVAEGAVPGKGVKEDDGAGPDGDGNGAVHGIVSIGEGLAAISVVAGGCLFEAPFVAFGDDPEATIGFITVLKREPDRHAAIALGVFAVVGIILVPMADLFIERLFLHHFRGIDGDAGSDQFLDKGKEALILAEGSGQPGAEAKAEDEVVVTIVLLFGILPEAGEFGIDGGKFLGWKDPVHFKVTVVMVELNFLRREFAKGF